MPATTTPTASIGFEARLRELARLVATPGGDYHVAGQAAQATELAALQEDVDEYRSVGLFIVSPVARRGCIVAEMRGHGHVKCEFDFKVLQVVKGIPEGELNRTPPGRREDCGGDRRRVGSAQARREGRLTHRTHHHSGWLGRTDGKRLAYRAVGVCR